MQGKQLVKKFSLAADELDRLTSEAMAVGNTELDQAIEGTVQSLAPNQIVSSLSGFVNPTDVQWITGGQGVGIDLGPYRASWLVTETGENRIQQVAFTSENPSFLFQRVNENHPTGLGPVAVTGDPGSGMAFTLPCTPTFTTYYVANAGDGSVSTASYLGGVVGDSIQVGGLLMVTSWWTR